MEDQKIFMATNNQIESFDIELFVKRKNFFFSEEEISMLNRLVDILKKFKSHWERRPTNKAYQRIESLILRILHLYEIVNSSDRTPEIRSAFFMVKWKSIVLEPDLKKTLVLPRTISDDEVARFKTGREDFARISKQFYINIVSKTNKLLESEALDTNQKEEKNQGT